MAPIDGIRPLYIFDVKRLFHNLDEFSMLSVELANLVQELLNCITVLPGGITVAALCRHVEPICRGLVAVGCSTLVSA